MEYRNLTYVEDAICRTQGSIYVQVDKDGYDILSFSDAYLNSKFCERSMDTNYSRFQIEFPNECLDFIYPEIAEKLLPSTKKYGRDAIYWAGYMYRALYFITGYSSKQLQEKISCDRLMDTYAGLHIEDDVLIFEDLCHIFKLENEDKAHETNEDIQTTNL